MYTLGAIFLVPLSIGVLLVNSNASQSDHVKQISHDLASMYAQGMDFSRSANQTIALRVGEGLGMDVRAGRGVLILSKILFGGFRGGPHRHWRWRRRMMERWEQMTPEEREKFRQGMRGRCGSMGTPPTEQKA